GVDHSAARPGALIIRNRWRIEIGRCRRLLAGEIRADEVPVFPAVSGTKEALVAEVQCMASRLSKEEREGPGTAIQVRVCQRRRNALRLTGPQIEFVHAPAENDLGVVWVWGNVVVFTAGGGFTELAEIDAVDVVRAARHACGA